MLYPTAVLQKERPLPQQKMAPLKTDDKNASSRRNDMYGEVQKQIIDEYMDSQGRNTTEPTRIYPQPSDLRRMKKQQYDFQREITKLNATYDVYGEAFRRGALGELNPNLVFSMNAFTIPEGYAFQAFHQPSPPQSYESALELYIRQICVLFQVPKRLFDEGAQKWKVDVTAESDPYMAALVKLRDIISEFFSVVYLAKNGFELNQQANAMLDKVKVEKRILNGFVDKITQLVLKLPTQLNFSIENFLNRQTSVFDTYGFF